MASLKPKVILITGTSSGFGLLATIRLARCGYIVYATLRDLNKNHDLVNALSKNGLIAHIRCLDVTKPLTIQKVVDEILDNHGRIDVLINNAGYGIGGFFEDLSDQEFREQMDTNFFGVLNVTRVVLPNMRKQQSGHIINISSIAGLCSSPSLGAYNASKWALEGFSESLYHEVRPFGVKVVLIEPGSYPTKIFKDNVRYAANFNNPQSPYFGLSQHLKSFVMRNKELMTKDPEDVARLIERIVKLNDPSLRYISDFQSQLRVVVGKILPPKLYSFIFRKVIYGKSKNAI